jgi:hypothetical protein
VAHDFKKSVAEFLSCSSSGNQIIEFSEVRAHQFGIKVPVSIAGLAHGELPVVRLDDGEAVIEEMVNGLAPAGVHEELMDF